MFLGSQQKITRPPPPPPPSNHHDHAGSVILNPDTVARFNRMPNQSGPPPSTPPPPPPPPRGVAPNNPVGTTHRLPSSSSDFIDHSPAERRSDQRNTAALNYDHDFENRFRFTPIENLPPPETWKQPSQSKSSKNVNVN
jgi:hypothetical protein